MVVALSVWAALSLLFVAWWVRRPKPVRMRPVIPALTKTDAERVAECFARGDTEGFAFWMLALAGYTRETSEVGQ